MVLKQKQRNVNTPWGRGSRGLVLGVGGMVLVKRTTDAGH